MFNYVADLYGLYLYFNFMTLISIFVLANVYALSWILNVADNNQNNINIKFLYNELDIKYSK